MIDTISIDIEAGKKELTRNDFRHPTNELTSTNTKTDGNYVKHQRTIQLFWEGSLEDYNYLPNVTYMSFPDPRGGGQKYGNNGRCHIYRITASLPKLVFGNNISELGENMFESIVEQLSKQLAQLDLPTPITKNDIRRAKVSRVDYGKNITLPSGTSLHAIQNVMSKAEHRSNSKFSQIQYREGELVRSQIKKRAVIAYDKLAEYNANLSHYKPPIYSEYTEGNPYIGANSPKILRFEVQLQKTDQLKRELRSLNLPQNTTFENIFSSDIARHILLKFWELNTKNIKKLGDREFEKAELHQAFTDLLTRSKHGGPQKVFGTLGFTALAKACGLDAVRQTFRMEFDSKAWRTTRDKLLVETDTETPTLFIDRVYEAIEEMEPLSLKEVYHD